MASPSIALRFRDVVPTIDTIAEHRAIIRERQTVWWGWWKKDFEEAPKGLAAQSFPIEVYLVDRSKKRMYLAVAVNFFSKQSAPDLKMVPEYYHFDADKVFGWFLLTKIEDCDYDTEVARSVGDSTILDLREPNLAKEGTFDFIDVYDKSYLLVFSDMHFGPDFDYFLPDQGDRDIGDTRRAIGECID